MKGLGPLNVCGEITPIKLKVVGSHGELLFFDSISMKNKSQGFK